MGSTLALCCAILQNLFMIFFSSLSFDLDFTITIMSNVSWAEFRFSSREMLVFLCLQFVPFLFYFSGGCLCPFFFSLSLSLFFPSDRWDSSRLDSGKTRPPIRIIYLFTYPFIDLSVLEYVWVCTCRVLQNVVFQAGENCSSSQSRNPSIGTPLSLSPASRRR